MQSWEEVHSKREWGEWPDDAVIRFVKGALPRDLGRPLAGMSVLELGCGAGANLRLFAEEGLRIAGIDISPSGIAKAGKRLRSWSPDWQPFDSTREASLVVGSVNALPWCDDVFDIVVDCECIYSLERDEAARAYSEAYRVASREARLLVRTFELSCYVGVDATEISSNFFQATAGPMSGLPPTRLSSSLDLPSLLGPWVITSIEVISRTIDCGANQLSELIVCAKKS